MGLSVPTLRQRSDTCIEIRYNLSWIYTLQGRGVDTGIQNKLTGWEKHLNIDELKQLKHGMNNKFKRNKRKTKKLQLRIDKNKSKRTIKEKLPIKQKEKKTNKYSKNTNRFLNIGTWNIQKKLDKDRWSMIIAKELLETGCDIAGLSEIRMSGEGVLEEEGFKIYYKGNDEGQNYGVGLAIRTDIINATSEFRIDKINDRLIAARLKFPNQKRAIQFIVTYRHTECDTDEAKKDALCETITKLIESIPNNDAIFVMGDFNARTGNNRENIENILGPYGMDERNNNGQRLINLCGITGLTIANTWYHKTQSQATYWDKRTKVGRKIDYILTRQSDRKNIKDCNTHAMKELSDHAMPMITVSTRFYRKKVQAKKSNHTPKINRRALKEAGKSHELETLIHTKFEEARQHHGNVDISDFNTIIYESAIEILGEEKGSREQNWIIEHRNKIDNFRKEHRKAYLRYKKTQSAQGFGGNLELLNIARKKEREIRGMMKRLCNRYKLKDVRYKLDLLGNRQDSDNLSDFYKQINIMPIIRKGNETTQPIKLKTGEIAYTISDILNGWKGHFEQLFTGENRPRADATATDNLLQYGIDKQLGLPPTIQELQEAIRRMKNRKSTGKDMIPSEILSAFDDGEVLLELHQIICAWWEKGEVPKDWKDAIIIVLHKKGVKTDCNNYRGISLMSHVGKVLAKVIGMRLNSYFESLGVIPEEQSGFRENRACRDMIFAIRRLQETCKEHNIEICACFVDLVKAYDSIDRKTLWKILKKFGVDEGLIKMIQAFHDGMEANISISGELSESLLIEEGLRQGCVMAPILFNIFFAVIFHEMKKKIGEVGIEIHTKFHVDPAGKDRRKQTTNEGGKEDKETHTLIWKLWAMLFADDAAFVAPNEKELQVIMNACDETCTKFGLTISIPKTKVLIQHPNKTKKKTKNNNNKVAEPTPVSNITIQGKQLEEVEKFKYLGVITSANASWEKEFKHRKSLAWSRFSEQCSTIYKRPGLPVKDRTWLFKTYISTKILYGCETWAPTKADFEQLESIQYNMLRIMLGKSKRDRINYNRILVITDMLPIESFVRKQRLIWAGNMIRMKDSRIAKRMFFGEVLGSRNAGKPAHTLNDAVYEDLVLFNIDGTKWQEIARNETEWMNTIIVGYEYFNDNWVLRKTENEARTLFSALPLPPGNFLGYVKQHTYDIFIKQHTIDTQHMQYLTQHT